MGSLLHDVRFHTPLSKGLLSVELGRGEDTLYRNSKLLADRRLLKFKDVNSQAHKNWLRPAAGGSAVFQSLKLAILR